MKDTITKRFHDKIVYTRRMSRLSELICEILKGECGDILDVGCGDGRIDRIIMDCCDNLSIKGIDVLVREQTYISVTEYNGENIPFSDNSVDYVMLIDVLHHTDEPAKVLSECCRVARKHIIIKDHILHGLLSYVKLRIMDFVGNAHYGVRLPYNYIKETQWEQMFRDNQLQKKSYMSDLHLYTGIFHLLFDCNLHFIACLKICDV